MAEPTTIQELWALTSGPSGVDRERLKELVDILDFRGLDARSKELLSASRMALAGEGTSHTPFPSLSSRLQTTVKKTVIEQYLRELGTRMRLPTELVIGGSSALILHDLLNRATKHIDLVDEVPQVLRELHEWRAKARERYGLYLAHFQSHYLPTDWSSRLCSLGSYGRLSVSLVDPVDIFIGKLFSRRDKDLDDLRALCGVLNREAIDARLEFAKSLAADQDRRAQAIQNYYIVFGQEPSL